MRIKMISTQNGSLDGIRSKPYDAGSEHDLSDSKNGRELAKAFVDAGMAVEIQPDPATPAIEPASAGFFAPVDGVHQDDADLGEQIDGQDLEPIAKSIEAAPENKMLKRPYNRKAK